MSPDPPPGFERGQRIQDGVIPLVVDGVTVRDQRHDDVAGGALEGAAGRRRDRRRVRRDDRAVDARPARLGARRRRGARPAAIGWVQVNSVPAATGPSIIWWLLPAVAGVSAAVAVPLGRSLASHSLVLLGGDRARAVGVHAARRARRGRCSRPTPRSGSTAPSRRAAVAAAGSPAAYRVPRLRAGHGRGFDVPSAPRVPWPATARAWPSAASRAVP